MSATRAESSSPAANSSILALSTLSKEPMKFGSTRVHSVNALMLYTPRRLRRTYSLAYAWEEHC